MQCRFLRKCGAAGGRSLPLGGAVAQRLRSYKSAEPEKTVKRSSRRTGVNLQFFSGVALLFGVKRGEQPLFRGSSASKSLVVFWFSFATKREHPSATTSYPVPLQLPLFLYTLCKKSTGKLRRTSRLTDTRIFFITAKDPVRGSTPRCGGTSAPRREPWRPGAARPSPPRGTPPARWGTP